MNLLVLFKEQKTKELESTHPCDSGGNPANVELLFASLSSNKTLIHLCKIDVHAQNGKV
jgi:hypothetical protein